jgi:hypothetical protein
MLADGEPAWLLAWQEQQRQPPPPAPVVPKPKLPAGNPNWHKGMASPYPQGRPPANPPPPPPATPRDKERHKPGPLVPLRMRGQLALIGIIEPDPWPFDGGVRREPVLDSLCGNRVVRKVGWHRCLKCRRPFWSEDVLRLRLCGGAQGCRGDEDRFR